MRAPIFVFMFKSYGLFHGPGDFLRARYDPYNEPGTQVCEPLHVGTPSKSNLEAKPPYSCCSRHPGLVTSELRTKMPLQLDPAANTC